MKFLYTFVICLSLTLNSVQAQPYTNAIGIRLGYPFGLISFKHGFSENHHMEALLEFRYRGVSIPVLYEYHRSFRNIEALRWYAGAGAGLGFYSSRAQRPYWADTRQYGSGSRAEISLHAIGGIEYSFPFAPVNLSFDYKPAFDILNGWVSWGGFGLGLRYVLP